MDKYEFQKVLEKVQEVDPAMPLSALQAFVWVALNDGQHQYDLEQYLGASNATASRSIKWWSEWKSFKEKKRGPGFIESFPDPEDKRYRVVRLTEDGKAFWNSLFGGKDTYTMPDARNTIEAPKATG